MHLDKSGARVYGGAHQLTLEELIAFRRYAAEGRHAAALRHVLADLVKQAYELDAYRLSRAPRGYPEDHPSADLLVYKNLFALSPKIDLSVAKEPRLVDECLVHAAALRELNAWFAEAVQRPSASAK